MLSFIKKTTKLYMRTYRIAVIKELKFNLEMFHCDEARVLIAAKMLRIISYHVLRHNCQSFGLVCVVGDETSKK